MMPEKSQEEKWRAAIFYREEVKFIFSVETEKRQSNKNAEFMALIPCWN